MSFFRAFALMWFMSWMGEAVSAEDSAQVTRRVFRRLTGSMISTNDPRFAQMKQLIDSGKLLDAARVASTDRRFFDTTLRNFSAPWSTVTGNPRASLDDMQTLAIGLVRDRSDIRLLLTGTKVYRAKAGLGIPDPSDSNNNHYSFMEQSGYNMNEILEPVERRDGLAIGVFGTRGFGDAYYNAGTNRRAVKYAFKYFLCRDIATWREPGLPDTFVRRDVDRMPAGDNGTYQADCRGCHSAMDGLAGAFSKVDFVNNKITFSESVLAKYNQHPEVYPDGHVTIDDSWVNYLTRNQQSAFGWRGEIYGKGIAEFAAMMSQSRAFSECMVQQAFRATCHKSESDLVPRRKVIEYTDHLESNQFDLRNIFERIAISNDC